MKGMYLYEKALLVVLQPVMARFLTEDPDAS